MDLLKDDGALEELEIELFLEAVFRRTGYDFREYSRASMRRRLMKCLRDERLDTFSSLQDRALHDNDCMSRAIFSLTVTSTTMFRDPGFYVALRRKVVPLLATYPVIRIWHAGCSTGEEVYSTAIVLEEEGIYDRCKIYATDLNDAVLQTAKKGIFPLSRMKEYSENYAKAGGQRSFSDYYSAGYDAATLAASLSKNLIFAQHNLATDASFNEFNLILLRNVMIYFNNTLRDRVFGMVHDSLPVQSILALGKQESLPTGARASSYEALDSIEKLYRRIA